MDATIIAAIITGCITGAVSLIGIITANSKHQAIIEERLESLTKQVEKHNSVIERTYELEQAVAVHDAKIENICSTIKP